VITMHNSEVVAYTVHVTPQPYPVTETVVMQHGRIEQ